MTIETHVLETLRRFDSATIANVIELFDVRSRVAGYTGPRIKAIYPELPPAVGYAITATFRSGYKASKGDVYGGMPALLAAAEKTPAPRIVVFQDLDEPPRSATYGEVMATTFQAFNFAALITSGAARDIEQVRAMKFPCFASSVIVSHGYNRIIDVNVPVAIDGLEVRPGNLLHADANGVIDVPLELAAEIAALCQPYVDAENLIIHTMRRGGTTGGKAALDAFATAFAQSKQQMALLGNKAIEARNRLLGAAAGGV